MSAILTIARLTFHEARRRRIAFAALLLGAVFLAVYGIGFRFIAVEARQHGAPEVQLRVGYALLLLVAFYGVHFLTVMLSIFSSAGSLSSEISSHTIQAVVTKPIARAHVVVGKWLGHAAMVAFYVLLLTGGILVLTALFSGYTPGGAAAAVGLLVLEAMVLVALSLLGGTRLSTTANGVLLFLFYALAFNGAWVGQVGALMESPAASAVGTVTGYLLPVEMLWRTAADLLAPDVPVPVSPFTGGLAAGRQMVPYAVIYTGAALALAAWAFRRRDL